MESKLMFLVVCVIGCAVSQIKAEGKLSTPTNLTSKITRNDCGKTKLCLDKPKGCDPSGNSECFFTSVTLTSDKITVELSGNSSGYIALAAELTSNVSQNLKNIMFVCGNNNGTFFFTTMIHIDTLEIAYTPNVSSIQGLIQPSLIQCVFSIPTDTNIFFIFTLLNISNIADSPIPIFLDIWKGSTNGTVLGAPSSVLESSVPVNLANFSFTNVVSNATSTTAGTTANATAGTTANATAGTTANSTVGTTVGTTAKTTIRTTAHSNASISLTSQLSHAAIFILGIFLHLI